MSSPPSLNAKKPPHKKRHTKPCRYFQTGLCPHKAQEDCDFAHVYSDQPILAPPKQCRYYLQGTCTNGIWCQYRHGEGSTDEVPSLLVGTYRADYLQAYLQLVPDCRSVNTMSGTRDFDVRVRLGVPPPPVYAPSAYSAMYPPGSWSPYADGFHVAPLEYAPSAYNAMYPPGSWSPYADGFHVAPLEYALSLQFFPPNPAVSPANFFDFIDSATPTSSPTSSVSDDGAPFPSDDTLGLGSRCYAAPAYFNMDAPRQTAPYLSPDASRAHFPQYSPRAPLSVVPAAYGLAPVYDIFSSKAPSPSVGYYPTAVSAPRPESPPRTPVNRLKLASYRTKPCRYFKPGSVCPNRDACTFIHADPDQIPECSTPLPSPVKLQHELPSKPLTAQEENTRKSYFPISWRVIGGGVLMGGAKEDNALSDADSNLLDYYFDGRADPVSRVLEIDIPFSAPATAVGFPGRDAEDWSDSMTPTGLLSRPRASSIPTGTTPMTAHVDLLRLFSAESPGGL